VTYRTMHPCPKMHTLARPLCYPMKMTSIRHFESSRIWVWPMGLEVGEKMVRILAIFLICIAECKNILEEAAAVASGMATISDNEPNNKSRQVISPAQVMSQAYERVKAQNMIGSTTALVALFDGLRHQLHFSNLGDSGLIVLRHIDSDVAGALKRDRHVARTERTSDLRCHS
jgi:hypothetical protein